MRARLTHSVETLADESARRRPTLTHALWLTQGLLALVFLPMGSMKLLMPIDVMLASMPVALPGGFVRFIGVAEVLGAIGLLLPGLLHIREELTPLAAAGLVLIMSGATVLTVVYMGVELALLPVVVGLLAAFVAYGRWRLASLE
jgi:uncharacterized membrane protein YphA (DoxX/SURF4 family)